MKPLTDHTPKPLLAVQGKPLMGWTLEALQKAGLADVVVNTAWLGEQIEETFGANLTSTETGATTRLHYSHEGRDFGAALETLGGICRALPQLSPDGQTPFWVAAGDVYCPEFDFGAQAQAVLPAFLDGDALAHLWLVPNPAHNPKGDFAIDATGLASNAPEGRLTFSTIALYKPALFAAPFWDIPAGNPQGIKAALGVFLRRMIDLGRVTATRYEGPWTDVGTPERLAALNT